MADSFSPETVESNLIEAFAKFMQGKVTAPPASVITADLGADSLAVREIVAELEASCSLTFLDEKLPDIKPVGNVVRIVGSDLQQGGRLSK